MKRSRVGVAIIVAVVASANWACAQTSNTPTPTVLVVATSLVITPYNIAFTSAGHSSMNCTGNSSVFGNFGNSSINCQGTETPPTETDIERHIYTYYTAVENDQQMFLLSCTRKWRWDRCPLMIAGTEYSMSRNSSKVVLVGQDGKQLKFELVASNVVPATPAASPFPITVESTIPNCDIEVDGNFMGSTPSTLNLAPGKHTITVKKTGYQDWSRSMVVGTGATHLSAEMVAVKP